MVVTAPNVILCSHRWQMWRVLHNGTILDINICLTSLNTMQLSCSIYDDIYYYACYIHFFNSYQSTRKINLVRIYEQRRTYRHTESPSPSHWHWKALCIQTPLSTDSQIVAFPYTCSCRIHTYIYWIHTDTMNNRRRKTSLTKYLPLTLLQGFEKGYSRFACERELETDHKL